MRNVTATFAMVGSLAALAALVEASDRPFLNQLDRLSAVASTVPVNGDVNPYGVAIVPVNSGALVANNVLISNFNNSANLQGTGSTIVQVSPTGNVSLFASLTSLPTPCPGGIGLTTAIVALKSGFVIVGSLPTTDGNADTAQAGCLIILNNVGSPVATLTGHGINGPWDMTAMDNGTSVTLFVTNVLNGTVAANGAVVAGGSVLRVKLSIPSGGTPSATSFTTIASAFPERTDPAALVIGPTGLGLGPDGKTLFVADTLGNRIAAIPDALSRATDAQVGTTVAAGGPLNSPLGLAIAPNGNILTVNGGDGLMVETGPDGRRFGTRYVDVSHSKNGGAGALFGLAIAPSAAGVYFVDDGNNTLNLLQ